LNTILISAAERSSSLFSEQAIGCLLDLLEKQVSEHSRHLAQYFQVFCAYAHRGSYEVRETSNWVRGLTPWVVH